MPTTSQLQAWLDAIREAKYSGARTVQFSDRSTTFASMADLEAAEADLVRQLAGRPKQTLVVATKGFCS